MENVLWPRKCKDNEYTEFFPTNNLLTFCQNKKKKQPKNKRVNIHKTYNILNIRKLWLSQTESVLDELRADSLRIPGVVQSHSNLIMNVFVHTTTLRI